MTKTTETIQEISAQHYGTFVNEQNIIKEAKDQLKSLRFAGESAAIAAKKHTAGTIAEKIAAIRAAWVPFKVAIAENEQVIAQHQICSDAAWEAYQRSQ